MKRPVVGYVLAFAGVFWAFGTLALEIVLHTRGLPELPHMLGYGSIVAGAVVGWWGFYWVDSARALRGGDFLLKAKDRLQRVRLEPIAGSASERRGIDHPPAETESVHDDDESR